MRRENSFSIITRVFLFCSGVSIDLISRCPRFEIIKYSSIGVTIFFTSIFAFISSFFAFSIILDSVYLIVLFSTLWGFLIFNLDRYIVSSMRTSDNIYKNIIKAIPRVLIGVFIAITISKPIEVTLLSDEISNYIEIQKSLKISELDSRHGTSILNLDFRKDQIVNSYNEKLSIQENYYNEYKCECDGTCGTQIRGRGVECFSKKKKYEDYIKQMNFEREQYESLLSENSIERKKLVELHKKRNEELEATFSYGFFNQLKILNEIDNYSIYFILFLFIFIELSPIITKLFSSNGPYDSLLMSEINQYRIEYLKSVDDLNNERLINKKMNELNVKNELHSKQLEIERNMNEIVLERYEEIKQKLNTKISRN